MPPWWKCVRVLEGERDREGFWFLGNEVLLGKKEATLVRVLKHPEF